MESNSTFVIVYLQHRVYHKKHQWNTAKSVNKCARLDLVRQMFFRKPQLADIQRINFSPCKSGALDPIWRQKSGAEMTLRTPKKMARQTPTRMAHRNRPAKCTIPSLPKPQPADSQQSTPCAWGKTSQSFPIPHPFWRKNGPGKKKKKHEKAELPYCSKKRYLKYANWHPVTYKNSAIQKQSKSTPAQIASPASSRHFFGTLLGPLLYSSSIKRTFAYENYWNGKCITFISSH